MEDFSHSQVVFSPFEDRTWFLGSSDSSWPYKAGAVGNLGRNLHSQVRVGVHSWLENRTDRTDLGGGSWFAYVSAFCVVVGDLESSTSLPS